MFHSISSSAVCSSCRDPTSAQEALLQGTRVGVRRRAAAGGAVLATGPQALRVRRKEVTAGAVSASPCTETPAQRQVQGQAGRRRIPTADGAASRTRSLVADLHRAPTLPVATSRFGLVRRLCSSGRIILRPAMAAAGGVLPVMAAVDRRVLVRDPAVAAAIAVVAATAAVVDTAEAAAIAKRQKRLFCFNDFFPRARTSTSQQVRALFFGTACRFVRVLNKVV